MEGKREAKTTTKQTKKAKGVMSQRPREKDGEQGHLQRDKNPHVAVVQQQGDCLENGSHHEVRRAEIRLRLVEEHMENEKVLETFIDKY